MSSEADNLGYESGEGDGEPGNEVRDDAKVLLGADRADPTSSQANVGAVHDLGNVSDHDEDEAGAGDLNVADPIGEEKLGGVDDLNTQVASDPGMFQPGGDGDDGHDYEDDNDDAGADDSSLGDGEADDELAAALHPLGPDPFVLPEVRELLSEMTDVVACMDGLLGSVASDAKEGEGQMGALGGAFVELDGDSKTPRGATDESEDSAEEDEEKWRREEEEELHHEITRRATLRMAAQVRRRSSLMEKWGTLSDWERGCVCKALNLATRLDDVRLSATQHLGSEESVKAVPDNDWDTMEQHFVDGQWNDAFDWALHVLDGLEDSLSRFDRSAVAPLEELIGGILHDLSNMEEHVVISQVVDDTIQIIEALHVDLLDGVEGILAAERREEEEVAATLFDQIAIVELLDEMVESVASGAPMLDDATADVDFVGASASSAGGVRFGRARFADEEAEDADGEDEVHMTREQRRAAERERRRRDEQELFAELGNVLGDEELTDRDRELLEDLSTPKASAAGLYQEERTPEERLLFARLERERRTAREYFPEFIFKTSRKGGNEGDDSLASSRRSSINESMMENSEFDGGQKRVEIDLEIEPSDESDDDQVEAQSVEELFDVLRIPDSVLQRVLEAGLSLDDLARMRRRRVDEFFRQKGPRQRFNVWRRRRVKALRKEKERQVYAVGDFKMPDNIPALFKLLRIPSRYADFWESQGKKMSDLPLLTSVQLRKLLPQNKPRQKLKNFLKQHGQAIKSMRSELLKAESDRAKSTKVLSEKEFAKWRRQEEERAREQEERMKRLSLDYDVDAGRRRLSMDDMWGAEASTSKSGSLSDEGDHNYDGDAFDFDVRAEADKRLTDDAQLKRWDTAMRLYQRGHGNVAEFNYLTNENNKKTEWDQYNPYADELAALSAQTRTSKPMRAVKQEEEEQSTRRVCGTPNCVVS